MSEHERGAYTPQPDAPLSFDARISRERRPLPLALLASCVLLSTLIVAVFLFYRSGMRGPSDAPMPVGTPVEQYKSPPPPAAPNSLAIQTAPTDAPATGLAPTPEQPVKRAMAPEAGASAPTGLTVHTGPAPVPATPIADPTPPAQQAAATPAPAQAKPLAVKPAPVVAKAVSPPVAVKAPPVVSTSAVPAKAKARPPVARDVASLLADDLPPAKVRTAVKPSARPAAVAAGGNVVQIGAYLNETQANDAWQKVAGLMGGAISGRGRHVEPVAANGSTRYRSQITGFASRADANAFCAALKAKKHDCIVKSGN